MSGDLRQESAPCFNRTLVPLKIPPLWFYICNNCQSLTPARSAVWPEEDMILCQNCLPEYRLWKRNPGRELVNSGKIPIQRQNKGNVLHYLLKTQEQQRKMLVTDERIRSTYTSDVR